MKKVSVKYHKNLPIFMEKGRDGFYVAECPVLEGCYAQGKTVDEALKNIREVIAMILEEKPTQRQLLNHVPQEFSLHSVQV
jgi:predicted RNase H-like HicB family nuclease